MTKSIQSNTFYWALTGIFGALHLVLTMVPLFVLSGGSGFISMGLVSSIVIGFVLGPFYGTIAVLMGSLLGVFIFNIGGILGPIIPVIAPVAGALIAGCLKIGQPRIVFGVYVLGLIAFLLSPIGLTATVYIWMHTIAAVSVLLLIFKKSSGWLNSRVEFKKDDVEGSILPILLMSFIALLGDSLIGGTLAAYWFIHIIGFSVGDLSAWYIGATILYPLERIAVTVVVTFVIIALMRALRGTQLSILLENTPRPVRFDELNRDEAS
ncbi:MAG: hypothetical protein ACTSYJ_11130 [Candidatus Thorarchaeota archaeon]